MALDKYSYKSDAAANLYRAAFYLAKGSTLVAKDFLEKSGEKFVGLKYDSKKHRLYWAEKILDQYKLMKDL